LGGVGREGIRREPAERIIKRKAVRINPATIAWAGDNLSLKREDHDAEKQEKIDHNQRPAMLRKKDRVVRKEPRKCRESTRLVQSLNKILSKRIENRSERYRYCEVSLNEGPGPGEADNWGAGGWVKRNRIRSSIHKPLHCPNLCAVFTFQKGGRRIWGALRRGQEKKNQKTGKSTWNAPRVGQNEASRTGKGGNQPGGKRSRPEESINCETMGE